MRLPVSLERFVVLQMLKHGRLVPNLRRIGILAVDFNWSLLAFVNFPFKIELSRNFYCSRLKRGDRGKFHRG